jgi:transketolase
MGLEDIAMMRCVFDSIVFYPSDAVSTYKLVEVMSNCNKNITYLRTTRMDTPVIYKNDEKFNIGGCKVLKESMQDRVCIVAAGITLHQALKAYSKLQDKNISVSVIDLYSIKPFDKETLLRVVHNSSNKLVIVEDHYGQGGIGEMIKAEFCNENIRIKSLYVDKMPRSGSPSELLSYESIDSNSILDVLKPFLVTE